MCGNLIDTIMLDYSQSFPVLALMICNHGLIRPDRRMQLWEWALAVACMWNSLMVFYANELNFI